MVVTLMFKYLIPKWFWDYVGLYTCNIHNLTASTLLDNRTPKEVVTGNTPDISEYTEFHIYQPCYYFNSADTFPNDKECLGRWLGVSHRVGQGLCYFVVNNNGQVISNSTVRPVTQDEMDTDTFKTKLLNLDNNIKQALESQTSDITLPPNLGEIHKLDVYDDTNTNNNLYNEPEALKEDMDEEEYNRCFKTRRIFVTQVTVNDKVHKVNFSGVKHDMAIIDSGCERNCCGVEAYELYKATLSQEDRQEIREFQGTAKFKFGGAGIYKSIKEAVVPIYITGIKKRLRIDVVDTDIPILIGLPVLKQLNLAIQYVKSGQDYAYFEGTKFKVQHCAGHHYIALSKAGKKKGGGY